MTACTTCKLVLIVFLILSRGDLTSAKIREPQLQSYYRCDRGEEIQNEANLPKMRGSQLQTYSKNNRSDLMQNIVTLTEEIKRERNAQIRCKLHKWKTSKYLRKKGQILQYKEFNDPIPLVPVNRKELTKSSKLLYGESKTTQSLQLATARRRDLLTIRRFGDCNSPLTYREQFHPTILPKF